MGVDYDAVLGVGVDQKEITYDALTEYGKGIIRDIFKDTDEFHKCVEEWLNEEKSHYHFRGDDYESVDSVIDILLSEYWFEENIGEYDFFYYLGLGTYSGNMYCDDGYGYRGVHLGLNDIDKASYAIQDAVDSFKKIVDLQPVIFSDLLVW